MSTGSLSSLSNQRNWNLFFSSLAFAEEAAANQCRIISEQLENAGNNLLASEYKYFEREETKHFDLAKRVCKPLQQPTLLAQEVYAGKLMSEGASPLERMACVHLAFEPAALAFLGYVHRNSMNLISDRYWSKQIADSFGQILRDEVSHVYEGKRLVKSQILISTPEEIKKAKRTVMRHRAFLKAGLKSFFGQSSESQTFLKPMLKKFDHYFQKSNEGVFA